MLNYYLEIHRRGISPDDDDEMMMMMMMTMMAESFRKAAFNEPGERIVIHWKNLWAN